MKVLGQKTRGGGASNASLLQPVRINTNRAASRLESNMSSQVKEYQLLDLSIEASTP